MIVDVLVGAFTGFGLFVFVRALVPARVVPIHSFAGDRFENFFPRVERRQDGEWWEV